MTELRDDAKEALGGLAVKAHFCPIEFEAGETHFPDLPRTAAWLGENTEKLGEPNELVVHQLGRGFGLEGDLAAQVVADLVANGAVREQIGRFFFLKGFGEEILLDESSGGECRIIRSLKPVPREAKDLTRRFFEARSRAEGLDREKDLFFAELGYELILGPKGFALMPVIQYPDKNQEQSTYTPEEMSTADMQELLALFGDSLGCLVVETSWDPRQFLFADGPNVVAFAPEPSPLGERRPRFLAGPDFVERVSTGRVTS